jgi:outer membrane protein assembly factor BamB
MNARRIMLLTAVPLAAGLAVWLWPKPVAVVAKPPLKLAWVFAAPKPGAAIAAPCIDRDAIHFAATHIRGFQLEGTIYSLNPADGRPRWTFDADDTMLPTASTPLAADGRLYFGEGMHSHFSCRMFCLDAASGKPLWSHPTTDHVEGGPVLAGKNLLFPAGNDGLYALDAATGARRWNFRDRVHIDGTPGVDGDRVYVGSGPSRKFDTSEVACLLAANGEPVWRQPMILPAWSTPVVARGRVFVGLGNGRLTEAAKPPEKPAGALACLDAATGELRWTIHVDDSVFSQPVVVGDRIVFGSRDGHVYGATFDGELTYRIALNGPVIAAPTAERGSVYAVSVPGLMICIDPATGSERWRYDLREGEDTLHVYAPLRIRGNRLYVADEARTPGASFGIVSLSCFELEEP